MRAFLIEEQKIVKKVCAAKRVTISGFAINSDFAGITGPQGSRRQEEVEYGSGDKIKIHLGQSFFSGSEIPSLGVNQYVENVKQKANTKRRVRGFLVCFVSFTVSARGRQKMDIQFLGSKSIWCSVNISFAFFFS